MLDVRPGELVEDGTPADTQRRLAAYWAARDRFIESGRDIHPSHDVKQMLAQVREPLLSVLTISADFRPAYVPLVQMARVLGRTDALGAQRLLTELTQLQPARIDAQKALFDIGLHSASGSRVVGSELH